MFCLLTTLCCLRAVAAAAAVVGFNQTDNFSSLENLLIKMKSSPPLTASDFLANLVSRYGVSVYQTIDPGEGNATTTRRETPSVFRNYLADEHNYVDVWPRETKQSANEYYRHQLPQTANCEPEMRTVHLLGMIGEQAAAANPADIFFPHCIRTPQCGGCCPSRRLACEPTEVEEDVIPVVHVRFAAARRRFEYYGTVQVSVMRHLACACRCIVKADSCRNEQRYLPEECRCVCPSSARDQCLRRRASTFGGRFLVWNERDCRCECQSPTRYRRCPAAFRFNTQKCSCDRVHSFGGRATIDGRGRFAMLRT